MRGPKPKPTKLKILAGMRPDRINMAEPTPPPGRPDPPAHLDPVALEEWGRVVAILESMRVLSRADGAALSLYCDAFSRYRSAQEDIAARGLILTSDYERKDKWGTVVESRTIVTVNPATYVLNAAVGVMCRLLLEFGMTPVSRSRVKADTAPPADRLASFLSGGKGG